MPQATTEERWAPIPGHDGYEVSDLGRVRSIDRVIYTRDRKRYARRGQMLRTWPERGYLCVRLGQGRQYAVHRLVLLTFVGPCPPHLDEALHGNGDRADARLANLRWGTKSENMQDKLAHGHCAMTNRERCPRRHPLATPNLDPANLRMGHRACWACAKARRKVRWCRRNGRPVPDLQEESDRQYAQIMNGRLDGRAGRRIRRSAGT